MTTWRIFVELKPKFKDHHGEALKKEWRHAGFPPIKSIRTGQAYEISGDLTQAQAERLALQLLTDPITQETHVHAEGRNGVDGSTRRAKIWPKAGVADPVADTVTIGAKDLGVAGLERVRTGVVYAFLGKVAPQDVEKFCETYLMNPLVQKVEVS